jgi:hypothetical protein
METKPGGRWRRTRRTLRVLAEWCVIGGLALLGGSLFAQADPSGAAADPAPATPRTVSDGGAEHIGP